MLSPIRQRIIAIALGELGKVSDQGGPTINGALCKKGWARLKQYFDEATDWGPDSFTKGSNVRNGIMLAGRNPTGGEWCGIFATWCFLKGGVSTQWGWGRGPSGLTPHYAWEKQNIAPGDIGVIAANQHHFIITKVDGDVLTTVNGNAWMHGITLGQQQRSAIVAFYHPTDDVWVQDDGTVTPAGSLTPAQAPVADPGPGPTGPSSPGLAGVVGGIGGGSSSTPGGSTASGGATKPTTPGSGSSAGGATSNDHPYCMQGSTGPAVRRIQTLLQQSGSAPSIGIDGIFGPETAGAVRAFQQAHGCAVDGIVGPETWAALEASVTSTSTGS
jgi:hypothetical protein